MEILAMVKVSVVWRLWLWRLAIKSTPFFHISYAGSQEKKKVEFIG
jgi:hypothetical protein